MDEMAQRECQHLLNALSEYIDGEAPAELCIEIERHLAVCTNCRVLINTLRKTISLYRELPEPEMPARILERLYATLGLTELLTPKSQHHGRP
jgi:anti-sigma factor RsiW